jgi:tetratricopeptide (TPR) repeat protein
MRHEYQTWNNCGPATISMALSHYGENDGQAVAASILKPDPDDKNVGPHELAAYARLRGYLAPVRVNGRVETLKALLAAGVPIVVETWFVPEPGDEMGHYRVLTGYSDADQEFATYDSYNGPGVRIGYAELDRLWRVFNRTYMPVYPEAIGPIVEQTVGFDMDDDAMHTGAIVRAYGEIAETEDAFGWFNVGSSSMALGDTSAAAGAYDRARQLGLPWRMLWYQQGPFEAYAAEERWTDVTALADANLRNAPNLEESLYWRGVARMAQGDADGARDDWQQALELNPNCEAARTALEGLAAGSQE